MRNLKFVDYQRLNGLEKGKIEIIIHNLIDDFRIVIKAIKTLNENNT